MAYTAQKGFSLLESLIALALCSTLCLSIMHYQLRLLQRIYHVHYQYSATRLQVSLAEKMKSCAQNLACQRSEWQHWESDLGSFNKKLAYRCLEQHESLTHTIYWDTDKNATTLQFGRTS